MSAVSAVASYTFVQCTTDMGLKPSRIDAEQRQTKATPNTALDIRTLLTAFYDV